jgi:DNA-binding MarR family transcriptional regulator
VHAFKVVFFALRIFPTAIRFCYDAGPVGVVNMGTTRRRDLRSLLTVPQLDFQTELEVRLSNLGFPAMRPVHAELLALLGKDGVRLSELVEALSLPKQTVGDIVDDLEHMRLVERYQDPDHGVIKRVRLAAKGKLWAAEVKKVALATESRWANRLGRTKMKSLRSLLEELVTTVEKREDTVRNSRRRR